MGERKRNWIEMNRQRGHEIEDDRGELGGGLEAGGRLTKACKRKGKEHKEKLWGRIEFPIKMHLFIYLFIEQGEGLCQNTGDVKVLEVQP